MKRGSRKPMRIKSGELRAEPGDEMRVLVERRWSRFRDRYWAELSRRPRIVHLLEDLRRRIAVTLVLGAQHASHKHAEVLREFIDRKRDQP